MRFTDLEPLAFFEPFQVDVASMTFRLIVQFKLAMHKSVSVSGIAMKDCKVGQNKASLIFPSKFPSIPTQYLCKN